MLILRLLIVLFALGIGGAVLLWLLTGQQNFRRLAGTLFRIALVLLFGILALFVLERVLLPL